MRILHVTAPAAFGGLERVVEALAGGHVRFGLEVAVVAVHEPGAPIEQFVAALRRQRVMVFPIEIAGRGYRRERAMVADVCRRWGADLIHTHGYRCDVLMTRVARDLKIPQVSTAHGFTGGGWKNRIYEGLQRRAFRRCAGVVAVSARLARMLTTSGVRPEHLWMIPNAWGETSLPLERDRARLELGVTEGHPQLAWVGRLSQEKGPDVLLAALELLDDLPLTVSFIGDGPEAAVLKDRSAEQVRKGRVGWLGAVPDAGRYLCAFDGFVLSSRTEGTPIALLEAIAAGVPVVATRVGGVPDVAGPEEALLVASESPAELADGIRRLLRDPEGSARRAAAARERLRREYALEPWLDRYEAMYRQICPQSHTSELCRV